MKICEKPRFVKIFKMIRGFCLKWTEAIEMEAREPVSQLKIRTLEKSLIEI